MNLRRVVIAIAMIGIVSVNQYTNAQDTAAPYKLIGYYTSYSVTNTPPFFVTDIPIDRLTHINYYAVNISQNGQCISTDDWADTKFPYPDDRPTDRLKGNFKQLQLLKKQHPKLKTVMTVGGWDQSRYFSDAAATHDSRIRFANSCIAFMRQYGFDGIDIDWRYPVSGGKDGNDTSPDDSANLTLLMSELRGQLDYWNGQDNQQYLLTMAVAPAYYENYQLAQVQAYVDWINLMAYGFEGSWSTIASPYSPLYGNPKDPRGDKAREKNSVAGAVKECLDLGVPADKIVVQVGLYGQAWSNVKPGDLFGMYQPANGVPAGTRPGGLLYYRDLLPLVSSTNFTRYFDDQTKMPWLYSTGNRVAISYEDQESIRNKALYISTTGLAGMGLWELSFDDDAHSLAQAAFEGLNATTEVTPQP